MQQNARNGRAPTATDDVDNHRVSTSDAPRKSPERSHRRRDPKLLPEPVVIERFWRDRAGIAIVVSIEPYDGSNLLHCRKYFTAADGRLLPTKSGVTVPILRIPDLARALAKAERKARELGLLPPEEST